MGQDRALGRCGRGVADRLEAIERAAANYQLTSLTAFGRGGNALFAEEVPDPGLAIGQGCAETIERDAALAPRIDLAREREKILDRAKMDVPSSSATAP